MPYLAKQLAVWAGGPRLATDLADATPDEKIMALAATKGRAIFDADNYTVDGVSGKTRAWVDRLDATHIKEQTTSGAQVAIPAASANFKGNKVGLFSAHAYQSNKLPVWRGRHDGSGMDEFHVFMRNAAGSGTMTFATTRPAGSAAGLLIYGTAGNDIGAYATNMAGGTVYLQTMTGAFALNVPTFIEVAYVEGGTPNEARGWNKDALAYSANSAGAPSLASDPEQGLLFGAGNLAGSSGAIPMEWRASYYFAPLTDEEKDIVRTSIRIANGILT